MSESSNRARSKYSLNSNIRKSAHGSEFDIDSGLWRLRLHGNREAICIPSVKPYTNPVLYHGVKLVFAIVAETRPAGSAAAIFDRFRSLLRHLSSDGKYPISIIDAEHVAMWVASGNTGTSLSHIRSVLDLWTRLRVPGVTKDARELMGRVLNPPEPTQLPGVKSWDPTEGPYRPIDDEAIKSALDAAFNKKRVKLFQYTLMRMFRATGARPDQVAAMKVGDLRQDGDRWYLRIPHAKQRDSDWRLSFMPWKPISQGFANLLVLYIETDIRSRVDIHSKIEDCPLFPSARQTILNGSLASHSTPLSLRASYKDTMEMIEAISPITGEVITGTPKRDRHTFLTHLAMNGCTAEEIAANAGHAKVASCTPYVDASIDHFQRMEYHIGAAFVPIADRFVGNVASQETDAHLDDVIMDETASGVGSCSDGGCNAIDTGAAPLACYSCRKFRAWVDAPHADLLDLLLSEQQRLRSLGHDAIAEATSSTIIAISDLLERIRLERNDG